MKTLRAHWLGIGAAFLLLGCAQQSVVQDAVLLARQGEERKAIALLEGYLREHPNATRERRMVLRLHAGVGDLAQVEQHRALLSKALGPTSPVPWLELGHALELQHEYDGALAAYDQAALVAPNDPTGPRVGGLRAARWGEFGLAKERLTEALRRDSRAPEVWHALGVVELQRGDLPSAKKAYESGLIADPSSAENHLGLATLALRQRDHTVALRHYDAIVRLRPTVGNVHLGRSWVLILLGRHSDAELALSQAAALGADSKVVRAQRQLLAAERAKVGISPRKPSQNR